MVYLPTVYASKNKITLELNGKDWEGNYPLSLACAKSNNEIVKLLTNFANKNKINLKFN